MNLLGRSPTHGHWVGNKPTPTWSSWRAMRRRCLSPRDPSYHRYGGAGVTVDPAWSDFQVFLRDMGERPPGTTLDRINSAGNYTKSNCRWANSSEQARNKRTIKLNESKARQIRLLRSMGYSIETVAKWYDVSRWTITNIQNQLSWM